MQYPQVPQPQTQGNSNMLAVQVNDESGAQLYPVAPGATVFLIDFTGNTFWVKTSAAMRKFTFEEIFPETRQDKEIKELKSAMDEMRKMLEYLTGGDSNGKPNQQHD